jgi:hypothetical protein
VLNGNNDKLVPRVVQLLTLMTAVMRFWLVLSDCICRRTRATAAAAVAADAAAAVAAAAEAAEAAEAAALSLKAVDVVAFNKAAETRFVEITKKLVPCPVSHLVRETAYTLDVSVETAKRYLLKHSASNAEFAIVRGIVVLRQKSQVV